MYVQRADGVCGTTECVLCVCVRACVTWYACICVSVSGAVCDVQSGGLEGVRSHLSPTWELAVQGLPPEKPRITSIQATMLGEGRRYGGEEWAGKRKGGWELKRSFHGNYQGGHVQKAKLQKQTHTSTHTQYEGAGPPGWGSLHRGHGLPTDPSPNLETQAQLESTTPRRQRKWRQRPSWWTEGTAASPPCLRVGSRGLTRPISPAWLLPPSDAFSNQPPLVRARNKRQEPSHSSNCPQKPRETQWGRFCQGQPCWGKGLGMRKGENGG